MNKVLGGLAIGLFIATSTCAQVSIALLKYNGGGDWYANPTSLPNLASYCNKTLKTNITQVIPTVDVGSVELYQYPFVHLTGHGNILFSKKEAENLRNYLLAGGFLHADDNYGLDAFFRKEMEKVFPELHWETVPFSHPIYHQKFDFNNGLPKIHAHDGKAPQGLGLFWKGRMVCFYSVETDLGDGWEDIEVHKDSPENHEKALKMGANIVQYVFTQQ
jgi:hypothetical protein